MKNKKEAIKKQSEDKDSMMETFYLVSNKNNLEHLTKSIEQHKAGKTKKHDLIEDYDE